MGIVLLLQYQLSSAKQILLTQHLCAQQSVKAVTLIGQNVEKLSKKTKQGILL